MKQERDLPGIIQHSYEYLEGGSEEIPGKFVAFLHGGGHNEQAYTIHLEISGNLETLAGGPEQVTSDIVTAIYHRQLALAEARERHEDPPSGE